MMAERARPPRVYVSVDTPCRGTSPGAEIHVDVRARMPNQRKGQLRAAVVVLASCRLSFDQAVAPTSAVNLSCASCQ